MTKRMLVDATHPEETRVAIVDSYRDNNRLDDLDFGLASKPILRGNIYLAKVMRIEPSLQAAFVEYGGNRHGFLPFSEIHPDYFRIPMADRPHDEAESMENGENIDDDQDEGFDLEDEDRDEAALAAESARLDSQADASPESAASSQEGLPAERTAQETASPSARHEESGKTLTESAAPATSSMDIGGVFAGIESHDSLITDFGNALVPSANISDVPMPPTPPESVGGDMAERFVRRHRVHYSIQEVLKRGQIMLIQVVKEERGNKGAALTTFLSLAGRYCVLMPNTDHGGGVSRKITNHQDRRRMKEILDQLEMPEGMAVILRTAGLEQDPPEIQRDLEYLLRLWDSIREQTLQSTAPALIYEEANLIKRSVRDLFTKDIAEILVAGTEGYHRAREFMAALMPDQVEKIKLYEDAIPLFFRYHVENQIEKIHSPIVQLRSGGYLVINPTEALVAIDVNSGRSTRERHIEETALKTNLEAAEEIARQLRLRDLAGLIVIDFIDMEDGRNNAAVERRVKEAMKNDRARLQIGRISPFGLMELSRQRLRPGLHEINFEKCPHCSGVGYVRSVDAAAFSILRVIEEEGIRQRGNDLILHVATKVALYIFNHKREALRSIEQRYDLNVQLASDDSMVPPEYRLERTRNRSGGRREGPAVNADQVLAETERATPMAGENEPDQESAFDQDETGSSPEISRSESSRESSPRNEGERSSRRRRFRSNRRDNRRNAERNAQRKDEQGSAQQTAQGQLPYNDAPFDQNAGMPPMGMNEEGSSEESVGNAFANAPLDAGSAEDSSANNQRRRRRGRRGGRGRNNENRFSEKRERWSREPQGPFPQPFSQPSSDLHEMPVVPTSIHELDTTPRAHEPRTAETERPQPSYEIVNPPNDKPKGGWWRRLTGQ